MSLETECSAGKQKATACLLRKTLKRTHFCVSQVRLCRLERSSHTSEEHQQGQYRQTDSGPTPSPRLLHCLSPSKLTRKEITQVIPNSLHVYMLLGCPNRRRTKWGAIDPSSQQKKDPLTTTGLHDCLPLLILVMTLLLVKIFFT